MGLVEKQRKAQFLSLLHGAPRQAPQCPHVGEGCGGCLLQEYPYEAQLKAKGEYLAEVYGTAVPVVAAPRPLGYRNRMDFVAAFGKNGLRKRGRFAHVVDIRGCLLLPEAARNAYLIARDMLHERGVQDYNYIRHEGFLRYIVVRASRATGQVMLILTTAACRDPAEQERFRLLIGEIFAKSAVTSLHWTISDGRADLSVGTPHQHLGQEHIIDEIAGRRFKILPRTFFQANTELAGTLFERAVRHATGDVLDLCCGVGVISIIASSQARVSSVTGVEVVQESVDMARENAQLNDARCEFICADMAAFLKSGRRFETVICDPARPGLGPDVCRQLLAMNPRCIIYISCNPLSHKEDLAVLSAGYEVNLLEGYDLFPQTPHVEVLSILEKRS